jgi:hypothetical protein
MTEIGKKMIEKFTNMDIFLPRKFLLKMVRFAKKYKRDYQKLQSRQFLALV